MAKKIFVIVVNKKVEREFNFPCRAVQDLRYRIYFNSLVVMCLPAVILYRQPIMLAIVTHPSCAVSSHVFDCAIVILDRQPMSTISCIQHGRFGRGDLQCGQYTPLDLVGGT